MVACGYEVVVAHNPATIKDVTAAVDVATVDDVVVAVGVETAIVVWVQQCWMRACTSSKSHFVLMVVTLMGNEPSWWYRQTTEGPHSTMGMLVCFQPWC